MTFRPNLSAPDGAPARFASLKHLVWSSTVLPRPDLPEATRRQNTETRHPYTHGVSGCQQEAGATFPAVWLNHNPITAITAAAGEGERQRATVYRRTHTIIATPSSQAANVTSPPLRDDSVKFLTQIQFLGALLGRAADDRKA